MRLQGAYEARFKYCFQTTSVPQGSKTAAKELSLMDARRSQNCNIMLAKLKVAATATAAAVAAAAATY